MWPRPQRARRSLSTAAQTELQHRSGHGWRATLNIVAAEPWRAGMASTVEMDAMRRAIDASRAVLGTTSPNPPVGAVVLDPTGSVVGVGATSPVGGPHAEIHALEAAGDRAAGGTLVVTLEPCTHVGHTGPCVDAIVAARVRRVVYAVDDPNPAAAGGAEALRAAGVEVEAGGGGGGGFRGPPPGRGAHLHSGRARFH